MPPEDYGAIEAYTNRGQGVFLVLFALNELGGSCSKQEVIGFIAKNGWYDVTQHDLPPYEGRNEPNYHTLLAWARKDCYVRDWLLPTGQNNDWSISRGGRGIIERAVARYRTQEWDVRRCYLWKPCFKKLIDPAYEPSTADAQRPDPRYMGYR